MALSAFATSQSNVPGLAQLLDVAKSSFVDGMQLGLRVSAGIAVAAALVVWRWYPTGQLRPEGMAPEPARPVAPADQR